MSSASSTRPVAPSTKAISVSARLGGTAKPRVSSEEPESTSAAHGPSDPSDQSTAAKPSHSRTSQVASSAKSASGPYDAITASRRAKSAPRRNRSP